MHAWKSLVAAVAATLTLGACATGGASSRFAPMASSADGASAEAASTAARERPAAAPARATTVRVENFNWNDVTVYVVQNGVRTRLGTITSMSTGSFRLPAQVLASTGNVRLLADPIGSSRGYMTEPILVRAGSQVSFNVQNSLSLSSVAVWE